MTTLMEKALAAVRGWPEHRQDEAAALLLALDRLGAGPYRASHEELDAIDEALEQVARGNGRPKLRWKQPSRASARESQL